MSSGMKKLNLLIIIEMNEDWYYMVSCPLFKGCRSYGETIDEALRNIREVIDICLEEIPVEMSNKFVGITDLEVARDA